MIERNHPLRVIPIWQALPFLKPFFCQFDEDKKDEEYKQMDTKLNISKLVEGSRIKAKAKDKKLSTMFKKGEPVAQLLGKVKLKSPEKFYKDDENPDQDDNEADDSDEYDNPL